jgi:hypothetical protein
LAFLLENPDYSFVGTNFAVFGNDIKKKNAATWCATALSGFSPAIKTEGM